jgi:hypothetical protein
MVWGERASRAGVWVRCGGSWMGPSFGNLFDVLYKPLEDICASGQVQGGTEHIASCRWWQ